jgi:RNA polymerase sigma-70 factor (ECF subfamily)
MNADAALADLQVHWSELRHYILRRVNDPALAQDIAQEAYLRLASLPENTVLLNPRAYLFATAANLVTDHARATAARGGTVPSETIAEALADPEPPVDRRLLSREALAVLQHAVATLPPRTRQVFELHKFEHFSYAEIADQLGIARNTVMVHMTRALGHCRDAMRLYQASAE